MTELRRPSILERDERLLRVIDARFQRAAERAGERLACRAGCDRCCHGPFPVTRLDRRRLRRGLEELALVEPERARALLRRARSTIEALSDRFPGDPRSGLLDASEAELDRFFERHAGLACPVLDPESGRCELYRRRPVSCRSYGPPHRFRGVDSAPCSLCFVDAPAEEVEACRYDPDPERLEEELLRELGAEDADDWHTLIPFALVSAESAARER